MEKYVENRSRETRYYDLLGHKFVDDSSVYVAERVGLEQWSRYFLDEVLNFGENKEIAGVCNLVPVPARTRWEIVNNGLRFICVFGLDDVPKKGSRDSLSRVSQRYLSLVDPEQIAVELSGGLDTSLLIEFLAINSCMPALVGIVSDRYEFRTEKEIQLLYAKRFKKVQLLPQTEVLPFSGLSEVPVHNYPDPASLYYFRHEKLARCAQDLGASVLLNGGAGDNVLCQQPMNAGNFRNLYLSDRFLISEEWINNNLYLPLSMRYVSAFSLRELVRAISKMRIGENQDPMKIWARREFKDILPSYLSDFAYKATHDAWLARGLKSSEEEIIFVFDTVYRKTLDKNLRTSEMIKNLKNYSSLGLVEQQRIIVLLAYATWLYGFINKGVL